MKDRFPKILFAQILGFLLLMSGVHTGILLLMEEMQAASWIQTIIPILYWSCVALAITSFVRWHTQRVYEKPLQELARASKAVAAGDFSVYVQTIHTPDKYDYLDEMIIDFNKMTEELGSIETLKTDFVSNVSHEMKTPIAVIKNNAQILRQGKLSSEETCEYANDILLTADRMTALITNILKLNKLENQRIVPEIEKYDVCEQIVDCILQFDTRMEAKNIDLEVDLEDRVYVRADREFMSLVWNNLLSNAVKFTEPGGCIQITQTRRDGKLYISVADNGCGMDEKTQRHIFDKFFQGDTSHATEGNGLGLALSVRVLDLMRGSLSVKSEMGKGSTFTVMLPLEAEE